MDSQNGISFCAVVRDGFEGIFQLFERLPLIQPEPINNSVILKRLTHTLTFCLRRSLFLPDGLLPKWQAVFPSTVAQYWKGSCRANHQKSWPPFHDSHWI